MATRNYPPIDLLWYFKHGWKSKSSANLLLLFITVACAYCLVNNIGNEGFLLSIFTNLLTSLLVLNFYDYLVKREENIKNIRRGLNMNIRAPFKIIKDHYPYITYVQFDDLLHELEWFDKRWDQRKKYLTESEVTQALNIMIMNQKLKELIYKHLYVITEDKKEAHLDVVYSLLKELRIMHGQFTDLNWKKDNPDTD